MDVWRASGLLRRRFCEVLLLARMRRGPLRLGLGHVVGVAVCRELTSLWAKQITRCRDTLRRYNQRQLQQMYMLTQLHSSLKDTRRHTRTHIHADTHSIIRPSHDHDNARRRDMSPHLNAAHHGISERGDHCIAICIRSERVWWISARPVSDGVSLRSSLSVATCDHP